MHLKNGIKLNSVFHTFNWRGWVGGLSQMKLTSFEKKLSHFETIPYVAKHWLPPDRLSGIKYWV